MDDLRTADLMLHSGEARLPWFNDAHDKSTPHHASLEKGGGENLEIFAGGIKNNAFDKSEKALMKTAIFDIILLS